jgi:hypothetical protein
MRIHPRNSQGAFDVILIRHAVLQQQVNADTSQYTVLLWLRGRSKDEFGPVATYVVDDGVSCLCAFPNKDAKFYTPIFDSYDDVYGLSYLAQSHSIRAAPQPDSHMINKCTGIESRGVLTR